MTTNLTYSSEAFQYTNKQASISELHLVMFGKRLVYISLNAEFGEVSAGVIDPHPLEMYAFVLSTFGFATGRSLTHEFLIVFNTIRDFRS
jgi:hypothetical protein